MTTTQPGGERSGFEPMTNEELREETVGTLADEQDTGVESPQVDQQEEQPDQQPEQQEATE
jgi:hypothetical protein